MANEKIISSRNSFNFIFISFSYLILVDIMPYKGIYQNPG